VLLDLDIILEENVGWFSSNGERLRNLVGTLDESFISLEFYCDARVARQSLCCSVVCCHFVVTIRRTSHFCAHFY